MVGGKDVVGRIDHVLNDKPRSLSQWSLEGTLQRTSEKVEEKTLITSSHLNLSGDRKKIKFELSSYPSSSCNPVKKYYKSFDKLDIPPGFEAHGKKFSL